MKHASKISTLLSVLLLAAGCGQGFQSSDALSSVDKTAVDCGTSCSDHGVSDPWEKVDLDGTFSSSLFGTHKVVDIDKINNLILVNLHLPLNPFGGTVAPSPISKLPGATVAIIEDETGYALQLGIPLKYIVRGVEFSDVGRLPNGDALPGVPGGELPKLGLKVSKKAQDVFLYLGKGAVAVFVPVQFPYANYIPSLTFPIRNKSQRKIIGYFASVAEEVPYNPGFFVSVVLPDEIQRIIDDILP